MQVCLPKHNYKLDNNLLTVEPRAVDPHCFDADLDPAQNDADPDPGGGGGRSAKNVHPPWQNPRYAPVNNHCSSWPVSRDNMQIFRPKITGIKENHYWNLDFKGTVSRDFLLLVFIMNQFPPSPRVSQ
jgi:hypothetical protein